MLWKGQGLTALCNYRGRGFGVCGSFHKGGEHITSKPAAPIFRHEFLHLAANFTDLQNWAIQTLRLSNLFVISLKSKAHTIE